MTNPAIPPALPTPTPPPTQPKSRKGLWITAGIVGGVILIGGVNAAARGGVDSADRLGSSANQPVAEAQVEMVTVPDVEGLSVSEARAALVAEGFVVTVATESDDSALVLSTSPAGGVEAELGSSVSITAEEKPPLTLAQENAVKKAQSYLSFMAFSRSGLIHQLEFEGFTTDEATFAVDFLSPDWNDQAAKKAEEYLNAMSFSRQGLIDQLIFEGFSPAEAEFGVTAVGY